MKNAYNGLLAVVDGTARGTQRQSVYTGIVRSVSPLTVEMAGILLTAEDLLINEQLLSQSTAISVNATKGTIIGKCNGCTSDNSGSVEFKVDNGGGTATTARGGSLTVGCRVVLITADSDKFILLCKVVSL